MRFNVLLGLACLALAVVAAPVQAVEGAPTADGAHVYSSMAGKNLTPASQATPASIARSFLAARGLDTRSLAAMSTLRENRVEATGLTHLVMAQSVDGLPVYGAYAKATVNARGELVHLIDALALVSGDGVRAARIDEPTAIQTAIDLHHPGMRAGMRTARGAFFYTEPSATRVAIPGGKGAMEEGFLVETWTSKDNLLHHTLIGGDGRIIAVQLRTNEDSYNIFPDHPGNSTQTVTTGAGTGNAESPNGWLAGSQTTVDIGGNNAHAYLDTDANNAPDGGGTSVTTGDFLTAANLSVSPATASNQEVAVQNLFYFNNVIHDKTYRHGFTEAAGNFQNDNFGNGGSGNDAVAAEAQDGSGTNNANFSTPTDGSPGRMQMFLWTQSTPGRDGDVDSDIIYHEFGHGLTWRMIGNMSGAVSGALGEGMSDVLSILLNDDDVVGEYSFNNPVGIRSSPYTGYPRTLGDFGGSSVHFDGEIYAATLWDLWQRFQANTVSQDTLFDYIVGGMNFTPSGPSYEDMRDGILTAASGSGHECLVWESFAQFGIGVGASVSTQGGGPFGGGKVTVTESFSLPVECTNCTATELPAELTCNDGQDNDCDGLIDGDDPDCGGGGCTAGQVGDACTVDADCCSNKCRGPSGRKTCK